MSVEEEQGAELPVKLISCCIPLVGLVLYFVWKDSKPQASKDVCQFALIGVGISLVLNVTLFILSMFTALL